ncbi:MAG: hypothetical protein IKU86_07255 [Thermoguttaceae bacterium]|nr:hypothetical protein [Thermoguttaceae bacterium]
MQLSTLRFVAAAAFVAAAGTLYFGASSVSVADETEKRLTKEEIVDDLTSLIKYPELKDLPNVREYENLKRTVEINGKEYVVWTDAIQKALDEKKGVFIPKSDDVYYIDDPIYLDSDRAIQADPEARIHAVPNLNACMLRNRHMLPGRVRPVYLDDDSSRDFRITVVGGIWSQEKNHRSEGDGASDRKRTIPGSAGVFLFSNVADLSITNVKIEKGAPFAFHVSNARDVFISDIAVETNCDGVHLNGPLSRAVVQNFDCVRTGDDCVAINAWDWPQSGPALGPIDRVLVQNCRSVSGSLKDIRLLPGVLVYPDGTKIDCPITNVVLRDLEGFNYFKMYAQSLPGRQKECHIGTLDNIYVDNLKGALECAPTDGWDKDFYGVGVNNKVNPIAPISILSNSRNLTFENLTIKKPEGDACLIYVGPECMQFWYGSGENRRPVDVFMSDATCVVENVEFKNLRFEDGTPVPNPEKLVRPVKLSRNPKFPQESPRGGDGGGEVRRVDVLQ